MEQIDKLQGQILEHKSYLYETDWYISRYAETGEPIQEDVKLKRAECRVKIEELRAHIKILESQPPTDSENVQL